jgi:hypothetical protein
MSRVTMTDGQFNEYCRRLAEELATQVELMLPRFLTYDPAYRALFDRIEALEAAVMQRETDGQAPA